MGVLRNTNNNPKLTKYLVETKMVKKPLVVIDIGARGGFEGHWNFYKDHINLIGFEADKIESNRLNNKFVSSNKKFYPVILGDKIEKRKFYQTTHLPSSGFYKPDINFWKRFPDYKNLTVKNTSMVETTTLDSFLKKEGIPSVDFIKIDVEGAEMDILKGAKGVLSNSVLGISIEVEFLPVHEKQAVFSEIDQFLNKFGFKLYDLFLNRHARKVLSGQVYNEIPGRTDHGQVLWGQAVYFKDPIADSLKAKKSFWTKDKILKLASLFEIVNLNDCSIELLFFAQENQKLDKNTTKRLIDLATPTINGLNLTYKKYLLYLKTENQKKSPKNYLLQKFLVLKHLMPLAWRIYIGKKIADIQNSIDKKTAKY